MATKNKDLGVRISKIRDVFCNGKNREFAQMVGISEQNASSYCSGSTAIGDTVIERILVAFPRINKVWLVLGDGEMLKPEQNIPNDMNQTKTIIEKEAERVPDTVPNSYYDRLITIIENRDKQIDRLISLLEMSQSMPAAEV